MFRADMQYVEATKKIQVKIDPAMPDVVYYRKITRMSDGRYSFSEIHKSIIRVSQPKHSTISISKPYILVDRHRYYLSNFERLVW